MTAVILQQIWRRKSVCGRTNCDLSEAFDDLKVESAVGIAVHEFADEVGQLPGEAIVFISEFTNAYLRVAHARS